MIGWIAAALAAPLWTFGGSDLTQDAPVRGLWFADDQLVVISDLGRVNVYGIRPMGPPAMGVNLPTNCQLAASRMICPKPPTSVSSSDGSIAATMAGSEVQVFLQGKHVGSVKVNNGAAQATAIALGPDGLLAIGWGHHVEMWEVTTGSRADDPVRQAVLSADGETTGLLMESGTVVSLRTGPGVIEGRSEAAEGPRAIAMDAKGRGICRLHDDELHWFEPVQNAPKWKTPLRQGSAAVLPSLPPAASNAVPPDLVSVGRKQIFVTSTDGPWTRLEAFDRSDGDLLWSWLTPPVDELRAVSQGVWLEINGSVFAVSKEGAEKVASATAWAVSAEGQRALLASGSTLQAFDTLDLEKDKKQDWKFTPDHVYPSGSGWLLVGAEGWRRVNDGAEEVLELPAIREARVISGRWAVSGSEVIGLEPFLDRDFTPL